MVEALAGEDGPFIEAGRAMGGAFAQVPLAEDGRLVAAGLQVFGEGGQAVVHRRSEGGYAVDVVVGAGEHAGAAGGADGVGAEGILEAQAAMGQAIQLRRLVDAAAIGGEGVGRVVIGKDEEEVGSLRHATLA